LGALAWVVGPCGECEYVGEEAGGGVGARRRGHPVRKLAVLLCGRVSPLLRSVHGATYGVAVGAARRTKKSVR
jgi:hypothetical protein